MNVLEGNRVVLRSPQPADAEQLIKVLNDPLIANYTAIPQPYSLNDAKWWIDTSRQLEAPNDVWLVWAASELVGCVGLENYDESQRSLKLGYWASEPARGKGYIGEATRLAIQHAFENRAVDKIVWHAHVGNDASWKLAWKLGFVFEGVTRQVREPNGRVVHMWAASLLRGEPMQPACDPNLPHYFDLSDHCDLPPAKRPYDPRRPQALVRQFHEVYGLPVKLGQKPTANTERVHMRMSLVSEEFTELTTALYGGEAGQIIGRAVAAAREADDGTRDTIEVADALADLVYVAYGMALECGIDLDEVLREVQASNMSKLGADGKPIYREDGKVLKGPGFFNPNIARVLGLESEDDK
ncbi:GNAT family N-acetyltransferase [uncultured Actinomyces sp.]|uniref:GNAT family N-acetyltransferase n=1 Tax=uncultured Actinomyces sp. TaxID=249061 RepID=UPI00261D5A09|nr:GNAT family N-acetyltransferase [uncultured Actinomyces sp.]